MKKKFHIKKISHEKKFYFVILIFDVDLFEIRIH